MSPFESQSQISEIVPPKKHKRGGRSHEKRSLKEIRPTTQRARGTQQQRSQESHDDHFGIHNKRLNELRQQCGKVGLLLGAYFNDWAIKSGPLAYMIENTDVKLLMASLMQPNEPMRKLLRDAENNLVGLYEAVQRIASDQSITIDDLTKMEHESPELSKLFVDILRLIERREEILSQELLDQFIQEHKGGNLALRETLDKKTFSLNAPLPEDDLKNLRNFFPSGNFLFHTTSMSNTIDIIKDGALLTSDEVHQARGQAWGRGGEDGIAFNMNDVRVLTGNVKHFTGFLISPENVLDNAHKLMVPDSSAEYEVRLVSNTSKSAAEHMRARQDAFNVFDSIGGNKLIGVTGNIINPADLPNLPRVPIENMFLVCNERDAEKLKTVLTLCGRKPKAILTYPNQELRVESWVEDVGDHVRAGELLKSTLARAGRTPSIDWGKKLFPSGYVMEGRVVRMADIERAKTIRKGKNGELYIDAK